MTWFLVAAASVAAVLLFVHSPFRRLLSAFSRALQLSISVIRNPAVSDHWKEKVLPAYALTIFKSSLGLFGCLLTLVAHVSVIAGITAS